MGFRKPDLAAARDAMSKSLIEIHSSYNDGWTSMSCKHELYLLKCWLDDQYRRLPTFAGEEEWKKDRIIELLKT